MAHLFADRLASSSIGLCVGSLFGFARLALDFSLGLGLADEVDVVRLLVGLPLGEEGIDGVAEARIDGEVLLESFVVGKRVLDITRGHVVCNAVDDFVGERSLDVGEGSDVCRGDDVLAEVLPVRSEHALGVGSEAKELGGRGKVDVLDDVAGGLHEGDVDLGVGERGEASDELLDSNLRGI